MPYDGSGNFTIINNFEEDRINGVSIDSLKMDNNFDDIANGLSNAMLRSGSAVMTGILNMGDHKITNLVAGTSSKDAVNKEQMDTALSAKQATIIGGASTITSSNLARNCALVSSSSGKVTDSSTTSTEIGYVHGVTSAIQTQLNGKQATITGAASTIASSNLSISRALVSNTNGKVAVSAVTATELGYLGGVTSAIQTQLNNRITTTISKNANGYWKDNKNGLIIQWGRFSNTNNNNITLTFPTPFTSTNYSINAMRTNITTGGYSYDGITGVISRDKTSCVLYSWYGNSDYDWIAIGY